MLIVLKKRRLAAAVLALGIVGAAVFAVRSGRDVPIFSKSDAKTIVLDAGHGDPDGGAVGAGGSVESKLNLAVAKRLKKQLEDRGFTVVMTRKDENGIHSEGSKTIKEKKKEDMQKRLDIINSSGADLFVSIHMNLFRNGKYRGAEVLYGDRFENSLLLAELVQAELVATDPENQTRTVKKSDGSIYLLKNAEIPGILAECGFLSNPEEEKLLNSKEYQQRIACAICDGITEYYKSIRERVDEI